MGLEFVITLLSTIVGKAKYHHLKPVIAAPVFGSLPFGVESEI
jgi:hypothetical protein